MPEGLDIAHGESWGIALHTLHFCFEVGSSNTDMLYWCLILYSDISGLLVNNFLYKLSFLWRMALYAKRQHIFQITFISSYYDKLLLR